MSLRASFPYYSRTTATSRQTRSHGATTLAELVAQARWRKNPKTMQLEPHREKLLRLRRAGESVAVMGVGLPGLGIEISDEALRLWLNRELGLKPMKGRKRRVKPVASDRTMETLGPSVTILATAVAGASDRRPDCPWRTPQLRRGRP